MGNPHVYTELLNETLYRYADKACFHILRDNAYRTWTYADFRRELNRAVSALATAGFRENDNAIVIGENTPEWVIAYHAVILAGGRTVPVDPNLPYDVIRDIVQATAPRAIFHAPLFTGMFAELASGAHRIRLDEWETFASKGKADADALQRRFSPDDPVVILFTSGTTGRPKGAVLAQRNFCPACHFGPPRMRLTPKDTDIAILPLHHVFGFAACVAAPLFAGLDIVFVPVPKGPLIVQALKDRRVSMLPAVPQMLDLFYANIKRTVAGKGLLVRALFTLLGILSNMLGPVFGPGFRRKLFGSVHRGFGGNLSLIISGGSSIREETFRAFRTMGFDIVEGYGLTETFGPITICLRNDARLRSVGPVFEDNEMRINNPDASGIGEVCFRGKTVFPGYYNNEEATRAVFDADGWFHTGDLGRVTNDGFLYLTGRSKDIIVLESGKNVHPDELEEHYSASPLFAEVGVLGIGNIARERVAAVVVPTRETLKNTPPDKLPAVVETELKRLSEGLPSYKRVQEFAISVLPLLRTTTRKIKKPELKKMYPALKKGETVAPPALTAIESELIKSEAWLAVAGQVLRLSPGIKPSALHPRAHLEMDLQLDSLRRIDLLSWMEGRFKVRIPEDAYTRHETLQEIVRLALDSPRIEESTRSGDSGTPSDNTLIPENNSWLYRGFPLFFVSFSKACWNLRVTGIENVPPNPPFILCANHESYLDPMWIMASLPWEIRRNTCAIGKAELMNNPMLAFLLRRVNLIAVEREGEVHAALKAAADVLRQGKNLILFPEGTRTRTGEMGRFKSGIGKLMSETGVPALPIRVRGGFALWPSGGRPKFLFTRSVNASVTFGRLMPPDGSDAETLATRLRDAVAAL
ncbi:MAG: AMP-binding protein [Fibrobacterota bacterium]